MGSELTRRNGVEVTAAEVRRLVDRPGTGKPVTSVYVNTDGARFPRPTDYEARLDGLLRDVRVAGDKLGPSAARSVRADADRIRRWVRSEFDRAGVKGLGLFASDGDIFESVQVEVPVRNLARVNDTPYVVPLQALLGRSHRIGLVIIERDKARLFRYQLGHAEEYLGVASDVHRQHSQGGWSQARFSRNIEHDALHHFKDTAEVLRKSHEDEAFDALALAGPQAEVAEFEKLLHPYLQKIVHGSRISLPVDVTVEQARETFTQVEQELVSGRRRELLARLHAAEGQAGKAARGIRHVVEAVNAKRVDTLFVVEGAGSPGWRSATGALALHKTVAEAFGEPVERVSDLVDECIEAAVRGGAHIELFRDSSRLDGHPIVALLRF
jgi:peptide chain release factor subunit 1